MFKPLLLSLTLSTSIMHQDKIFILDGDYTEVAREFMNSQQPCKNSFDPNDLLYKTILKEIENGYLD